MVIDCHVHIGTSLKKVTADHEEYLSLMESCGIDRAVIFPIDAPNRGETYERPNDEMIELARENPGRIIPFCRLQPKAGKKATDELSRCHKAGSMGLKLHPVTDQFLLEDCHPLLEAVNELEWPLVLHVEHKSGVGPGDWRPAYEKYSKITFILAHAGKDDFLDAGKAATDFSNVFLDTSTLSYNRTRILIEKVGAHKILFASDFPYSHPLLEKKKLELLCSEGEALSGMLGENAHTFLKS